MLFSSQKGTKFGASEVILNKMLNYFWEGEAFVSFKIIGDLHTLKPYTGRQK